MLANANPLEAAPASRSVREFIAVCARHNLPYGEISCLPTLLRELNANKHFAMHFWSVVARQSANGAAVLPSVVEAVTGRPVDEVREAGPSQRILLDRLEKLLAGQDVGPEVAEAEAAAATRADGAVSTQERGTAANPEVVHEQVVHEDVLPIRRVGHVGRRRAGRRRDVEAGSVAPAGTSAARDDSMRLVLLPELAIEEVPQAPGPRGSRASLRMDSAPPIPVPLSAYAEEAPRRSVSAKALAGVAVVVALAGCGFVLARGGGGDAAARLGDAIRAGYDSAVATWNGAPAQTPAVATAPAVNGGVAQTNAAVEQRPAPTQADEGRGARGPQTTQPAQPSRAGGSPLTPAQSMAATAAYNQQRDGTVSGSGTVGADGLVHVPENVMNAHLIVSRVPVLPDEARDAGVTGVVRMQATINRSGYVSRLHVLQGPTELRHAALDAVAAWRYRPYLIDGQPADVMTTITVDFSSLE